MATIRVLLLNTLNDLLEEEFKSFKWQLTNGVAKGFSSIARSKLEKAKHMDVVDLMVNQYGLSDAGKIAVRVLQNISQNNLAENLKKQLAEVQAETADGVGASSNSALAPTAPGFAQSITADTSSKVMAPVITGVTFSGPVNFSFK
ncbi:hypothetical protein P4O66_021663 [Electrophorus voltai]|uniref:Pyrin domain-containing protein n=1 Tax=Electrophorus voltai TaxID=2609070 RepID=A0AAD8ZPY6_9TELE|nr:hypothetical protein P4O66_021663 [Electrophorus voltai]